jgi:hypothetical protein
MRIVTKLHKNSAQPQIGVTHILRGTKMFKVGGGQFFASNDLNQSFTRVLHSAHPTKFES